MGPKDFGVRLVKVRERLNLRQADLASLLDVSQASITKAENGHNYLSAENLASLAEKTGASLSWLMTGEGEMFLQKATGHAAVAQPAETAIKPPLGFVSVPILSAVAALGQPIENEHERPEGPPALLLKAKVRHPRDTYALRVRGDSMLPTLCDGFLVFVDRNPDALRPLKALDGKLVVVRLDQGSGGISIKRVQVGMNALTITADHPEAGFAPVALRLDQADRILAKVIGWWGEQ